MSNLKFAYSLEVEPICIRQLNIINSDKNIIIKLWQPYLLKEQTWSCAFQIAVADKAPYTSFVLGADSFQALILALKGIQVHLDYTAKIYDSGIRFSNFDPLHPADHNFPFFDPAIPSVKYDSDGHLKQN